MANLRKVRLRYISVNSNDLTLIGMFISTITQNHLTMSADKKIQKDKLPHPAKENTRHKAQEEYDDKGRSAKAEKKVKRVNYVVKDLPIY